LGGLDDVGHDRAGDGGGARVLLGGVLEEGRRDGRRRGRGLVGRDGEAVGGRLLQPVLHDLQRQEVVALVAEDPAQALDVGLVELPVPGWGPLRVEQPLALEEPDLRDRDVREVVLEQAQDLADRQVGALGHR
jgi:hypothetical protein